MKYLIATTLLSPLITHLIKAWLPQIPKKYLPMVGPILGGLAEAVTRLTVGTDLPEGVGVAAGAAGVAVREIVDQWRKDGSMDFRGAAVVLLILPMLGCSSGAPLSPGEEAQRRCERAETLLAAGRTTAALALKDSQDADLKDAIVIALDTATKATADYCDAVFAGQTPDAERIALRAFRQALDALSARVLGQTQPG